MKNTTNTSTPFKIFMFIEISLFVLGVTCAYFLLVYFAPGGPISTDVLGYSNVSLLGLATPHIMNRYTHIFLQAIFFKLASTPLVGMQHYWAFLITCTGALTYLAARLFSSRSHVAHGLLAVALFFSISEISNTAGVPLVDITAMFMMMLFTVLVILSARRGHRSLAFVFLLGFVLYLAFKAKETALLAALPLFGLGATGEKSFVWRLLFRRVLFVFLGMMTGVLFFVAINAIYLHSPWFGFRASDLQTFFGSYIGDILGGLNLAPNENWFTAYLFTGLLIPFSLYVVSAMKAGREFESYPGMRFIWMVPLAVIIFVSVTVSKQWGFAPRYVFTIFPFISFLAPQYLDLDLGAQVNKKQRLNAILGFITGLVLVALIRIGFRLLAPKIGWDIGLLLGIVFIPVLLSIILTLSFSWKILSRKVSIIITVLVLAIISIFIVNNIKVAVRDHPNLNSAQQLFYPFSAFSDQIHYTPGMHMYVSLDTWRVMNISALVKDRNELSAVFNVYFDASSSKDNFTLPAQTADISTDLLSTGFEYALLSMDDWKVVSQDLRMVARLSQDYQVYQESTQRVVFLKLK